MQRKGMDMSIATVTPVTSMPRHELLAMRVAILQMSSHKPSLLDTRNPMRKIPQSQDVRLLHRQESRYQAVAKSMLVTVGEHRAPSAEDLGLSTTFTFILLPSDTTLSKLRDSRSNLNPTPKKKLSLTKKAN